MDSNGTKFILIKGAGDFRTSSRDCGWNSLSEAFTLSRRDRPRLPRLSAERAMELWREAAPYVVDDYGLVGRLSTDRRSFEWSRNAPGTEWQSVRAALDADISGGNDAAAVTLDPVNSPEGTVFTDLHLGGSGLVALPYSNGSDGHGLLLVHLRRRWQARCTLTYAPRRVWVDGKDRIWVAGEAQLGLCQGAPLLQSYFPRADRFEPLQINPDPLRMIWLHEQKLPVHGGLMALAADDETLVLLVQSVAASGEQILLTRPLNPLADAEFTSYPLPADLPTATDISCVSSGQILLLPPFEEGPQRGRERDCPMVLLTCGRTGSATAHIEPERWPRRSEAGVRFVRHRDNGVRTLTEDGVLPLYRLAQARFVPAAAGTLTVPLDSGTPGTVWHRLYLEAAIPPGCTVLVEAQAFEVWRERPRRWEQQPEPAWLPAASELPFAGTSLNPLPGHEGLFEVLLQRSNGAVRDLAGRYLRLRLILSGDGRHTPAIHAIRAWYPRFSWQSAYLPGHFHQQEMLPAAVPDVQEAANAADLRERLLACFEGVLTPIEDRIAAAETLLYPDAAPAAFLPLLAELTATRLPRHWPEPRQRRWLAEQGELQRQKGTFGGLCRGLDVITDGGVRRGEVVPVEMFRLRRTFATVLGISMDDADHPLTLGTGQSGNSRVGETLILAEDTAREFLALFAPELAEGGAEQQAVARFFDSCARRMTVVLHGAARSQRQVVARALPELVPGVIQWQILESDHPFVLGLSPLLCIDTWLEREPEPQHVQLDRTRLGRGDVLQNPVSLAPEYVYSGDSTP